VSATRYTLGLIAPDLNGPPTGGTLYNAHLVGALQQSGVSIASWQLEPGLTALERGEAALFFVDSLYLEALPALRARASASNLYLLLHYLPSLVTRGGELAVGELSPTERSALEAADGFLVTSSFMQRMLARLGVAPRAVLCVEPGVALPAARQLARDGRPRAVMLANLVPGKGVRPLLAALGTQRTNADRFELLIAGRLDQDPGYAQACQAQIAADRALAEHVRLLGALPHDQALVLLQSADALLSTSSMEAYGMALGEARAAGVPIIARRGGHAGANVDAAAGGVLVDDEAAVAAAWLELVRSPELLKTRRRAAAAAARVRSWDQAAAELVAQLRAVGTLGR
jgi:glycosyltransferase involved in cell wall biosynthesis